jgi:hypothetical protein
MPNYFETAQFPFFTADFDYFRLAREKWELGLTRLAQMGVQGLMLTIPWGFHEIERGRVDLNGATNPRRNLAELLNLCAALHFPCILKLGPSHQHSGLLNNGLPYWLARDSVEFEAALPAALEGWYISLGRALAGWQWPEGPLVLLYLTTPPEQAPTGYSKQLTTVQWPIWLRKRYGGVEGLNTAYGAAYRSVNEVDFPQSWGQESNPLEQDARVFLAELQADSQQRDLQTLAEAGWRLPIYAPHLDKTTAFSITPMPATTSLAQPLKLDPGQTIVNLEQPIQVDPDPADVGAGPVWATEAPIRSDGSVRRQFWQLRASLWQYTLPHISVVDPVLTLTLEAGSIIACGQDTTLKLELTKGAKPVAYRLDHNGELILERTFTAARGKLNGLYLTENRNRQTDLIFVLNNSSISGDFISTYLRTLLRGQTETLTRCAALAAELAQTLASDPDKPRAISPPPAGPTSYSLTEARRGLREADAILRKAVASIGGLEAGFGIMLNRGKPDTPQPAAPTVVINPEIFDGPAREALLEVGRACAEVGPELNTAAAALQKILATAAPLTPEQYQQSYTTAVAAAQTCRRLLLNTLAGLRLEIATEELPLVAWRVHDQLHSLTERLRWGVLRGYENGEWRIEDRE